MQGRIFVLKCSFFKTKSLNEYLNQTLMEHRFCALHILSMQQKSLGYGLNKSVRLQRYPEKVGCLFF